MALTDFFSLDGITQNLLKPGELVTHLTLPENTGDFDGDYLKLAQRDSWDFPEAGIAAAWKLDGSRISELRVASTGLESIPRLHNEEVDAALSNWNGEESVNSLAEAVRKAIKPVNNTHFQPSYRRKMVRVLTQRCLKSLKDLSAAD
jgi:CO/xanthine dehydrogenase FAD-binding subunit